MRHKNKGFILIGALGFLFFFSLFMIQILSVVLAQKRFLNHWRQQEALFSKAENGLSQGEKILHNFNLEKLRVQVTLLQKTPCYPISEPEKQIIFYQIQSRAFQNEAHVTLVSTYAKFPNHVYICQNVVPGRQSWRQLLD